MLDPRGVLRLDPLRAWRFVAGKVSGLGAVTSPPYDVLEPAIVRRLTDSDLHNMVRLILPRDPDLGRGRYDEPAHRLARWQRDGVVVQDERPALYVYEQRLGSAVLCGLVGSLRLDPTRQVVLPHEEVMPHWVEDRLQLMEATDADLEPILLAYADGGAASDAVDAARSGEPWVEAETYNGAEHRIWRIDDPEVLATIELELAKHEAVIADGHHRYAAYLERQLREPYRQTAEAGLAMLVDYIRHPLTLDPIHRVVPGLDLMTVQSRTPAGWQMQPGRVEGDPDRISITDGSSWLTLHTDSETPTVALLHEVLFPAWGVVEDDLTFHHTLSDALALAGPQQVVVELAAPRMDQVLRSAAQGVVLPQKATSFGPKPRVGLLFRTL
ncbi:MULTISPECIES: DUF1015 family protein [Kribbella]|jgi:uncharacterized protein (DUF1015 family)|uniref:Uncharacterized protein (DUF1015 family) n=1 Tax=Kribbella pratensis TaxID=2512112 RepID=A0ABY2F418_9ACTN|nr:MULTISPECIES: DUF1015 domain-containing protein [Kribbella]TDW79220.1 uncharacterized protein (DUF1015 family) [Kribbella pratensis]TDW83181.1 uncharacterized protein (DUF1015 family) [Kribbella sp. VKM Ac-2566]